MPNCWHSLRRFTPSCLASITNSRRWSMTDTSRHGMARPLVRRIQPILRGQPCPRTGVSYVSGLNTSLAMTKTRKNKMSDRLKGKHAVVTAAAAGIGRACAVKFAREGATVIATDINEQGLATLSKEGIAETAKLDVRNTADV